MLEKSAIPPLPTGDSTRTIFCRTPRAARSESTSASTSGDDGLIFWYRCSNVYSDSALTELSNASRRLRDCRSSGNLLIVLSKFTEDILIIFLGAFHRYRELVRKAGQQDVSVL